MPASRSRSRVPAPVFVGILATNMALLLLSLLQPGLRQDLALISPAVLHGEMWRLVTYAWMHAGPVHLGGNMLLLAPCALYLEPRLGSARFAGLYLASVVVGGVVLTLLGQSAIGASGAVCAMALLAVLTLIARGSHSPWLILPEIAAGVFVLVFWLLPMVWGDVLGLFRRDGVSHVGHLAGFLTGWGFHRLRLNA